MRPLRVGLLSAIGLVMAGCAQMPNAGPSGRTILSEYQKPVDMPYELFDVRQEVVDILAANDRPSLARNFAVKSYAPDQRIGVGDTIALTVFEAGSGGLFTASAGSLGGGSKNVPIPVQTVSRDGTIFVPFVGNVRVAGQTPAQVTARLKRALEGKALDPQVLVTIQENRSNVVTVGGDVNVPGRLPLSLKGDRLLDVIAASGGAKQPARDTFIRITRGNRTGVVPMQSVIDNPEENVYVLPGDTIYVYTDPQTFTAFGATGRNGTFPFAMDNMALAEAIAAASGLNGDRATPRGVFVFRFEKPEIVSALRPNATAQNRGEGIPVIYRLDLTSANGFFYAKQFQVRNKDLIYIANADSVQLQKLLQLIGSVMSPAMSVSSAVNAY
jgi:polysaccharide export outer membrane protein